MKLRADWGGGLTWIWTGGERPGKDDGSLWGATTGPACFQFPVVAEHRPQRLGHHEPGLRTRHVTGAAAAPFSHPSAHIHIHLRNLSKITYPLPEIPWEMPTPTLTRCMDMHYVIISLLNEKLKIKERERNRKGEKKYPQ